MYHSDITSLSRSVLYIAVMSLYRTLDVNLDRHYDISNKFQQSETFSVPVHIKGNNL